METDIRKKIVIPFIIFLAMIATDVNSAVRGIEHHETWRIVIAGVSGLFFIIAATYLGIMLFKGNRKTT